MTNEETSYLLEKSANLLKWWHYYLMINEKVPDRILEAMGNLAGELDLYINPVNPK